MKKLFTCIFVLFLVTYFSGMTAYAQGKGRGQGGGMSQGRNPAGKSRPDNDAGHAKMDKHDRDKDKKPDHDAKEVRKAEKFEDRMESNPALRSKVQSLLPAGTDLKTAASGFRNQGQFLAALHVSKNLGIPFSQVKTEMTGTKATSLGAAIHKLRPNMTEKQANEEAKKAEKQAKTVGKS